MPRFLYKVKNADNQTQEGIVEAATDKQAVNLLHEKGFFIITLKLQKPSIFTKSVKQQRISFTDLLHITRQLATMITVGLTLDKALLVLTQQVKSKSLLELLNRIEDDVKQGKSFSNALGKYPHVFTAVFIALVRAGEASGKLDLVLIRLADNLEKTRDFRNKVRGALLYPSIILSGMVVVTFIVMTVVVPRLTSLYKEFGVSLPLPTRILIAVSSFFVNYWWLIIFFMVLLAGLYAHWRRSKMGQFIFATISLNLPIFGKVIREMTLVEVTRTLAILIESGIPILSALEIAQGTTNNVLYKEAFADSIKKVEKGLSLSEPFTEHKIFPPILGLMVAVGEQTGKVGESLFKLSGYFETEADSTVRSLTTVVEPLIMVVLGVGVGFLVMAVLMPIYSLTTKF